MRGGLKTWKTASLFGRDVPAESVRVAFLTLYEVLCPREEDVTEPVRRRQDADRCAGFVVDRIPRSRAKGVEARPIALLALKSF